MLDAKPLGAALDACGSTLAKHASDHLRRISWLDTPIGTGARFR